MMLLILVFVSQNSDDFEDFEDNDIMPDQCEYKKSTSHPCIYACVTMWHETEAEMMNILQSLYRYVITTFIVTIVFE